jgi:hypothetical protein
VSCQVGLLRSVLLKDKNLLLVGEVSSHGGTGLQVFPRCAVYLVENRVLRAIAPCADDVGDLAVETELLVDGAGDQLEASLIFAR